MSSIHKALKKAQRERDFQHQDYDGVLTVQGDKHVFSSKFFWLGSLAIAVGLSILIVYFWFNPQSIKTAGQKIADQKDMLAQVEKKKVPQSSRKTPESTMTPTAQIDNIRSDKPGPTQTEKIKQMYDKARAFQKSGRLNDAKGLYQKVLKTDPGFIDALNNLGVIWMQEKNYQAARANFERAIRLEPENVDPQYNLACVYALNGELKQSILHLKKAFLLNQDARQWARTDADLTNLRNMPEFEIIIKME